MGWNSWYAFRITITEQKVKEIARALISNGMKAAGYDYINIDDGWMGLHRDAHGRLHADSKRFPDGIKALVDYIHSLGLKFGLYISAGTKTCAGFPGSLGHEKTDAETFAKWGIDYLKMDNCYPVGNGNISKYYIEMSRDLIATGRPIVFSICDINDDPVQWASKVSNLWRIAPDIQDNWHSLMSTLDQEVGLYKYAGPGHWNDPDMLQIGNGGMTTTEYQAYFSLWSVLAAPLITSTDLRHMTETTRNILTNKEVIAVDQDKAGIQGRRISKTGNREVWVKPLSDGSYAVLFLNRGSHRVFMTTTAEKVGLAKANSYKVVNLWAKEDHIHPRRYISDDLIRSWVPSHGVAMFRVWPGEK